ncbi:tryptophan halogenase family protein [Marinimicrobium alkaliphilum]|uniref:tryptophan halogenase family protein n=1 Tax=Marinimicrobium alkaliphilum TaxID=2202654 RepID=UPI000DBA5BAC|nr:tryptophan halogenase family protein [Marinimicrobium alkaliphilum]
MIDQVKRVVIVGGGSAGWLTAGIIAAEHAAASDQGLEVILVEAPDIKPIGVGEGTWPSMRATLERMGISETEFIGQCDVSFKQGSRFNGWIRGGDAPADHYYHPFTLPTGYPEVNLAVPWQQVRDQVSYAEAVCPQVAVCNGNLAPKTISTPEYAFALNYGYHLNAGKFADFLRRHCTQTLGVTHIKAHVSGVRSADNGDISALLIDQGEPIVGDLFVDCTGLAARLLGEHYGIGYVSKRGVLFNDTALAVQVDYPQPDAPIVSHTLSTAQRAGWVWDIGLPTRRGVGYVYSSAHSTDESAEAAVRAYLAPTIGKDAERVELRKLSFNPGHRREFWHRNCVAVGLSAGFLEPLEATALVLVELSATMIAEQLPSNRQVMDVVAGRFNRRFLYHWERIIDFLKLHYVLSERRDSDYWRDNLDASSVPDTLAEQLLLWRHDYPWRQDTVHAEEMFPSASFAYVLYGMGFSTAPFPHRRRRDQKACARAGELFRQTRADAQKLSGCLPSNRALLKKINAYGLQTI